MVYQTAKNCPKKIHIRQPIMLKPMKFLQKHSDQGIDAAITLQDGATYLFKGNFFVKFNNVVGENLSQRFPSLLSWCFKDLPGTFARGFDSFVCHKAFGRALATKGAEYIRFKDPKANGLSSGYPKSGRLGFCECTAVFIGF